MFGIIRTLFEKPSKKFFTAEYCLPVIDIRSVRVIGGHYVNSLSRAHVFRPVQLVVNDHGFGGEDALRAAKALLECGYYTAPEHSEVEETITSNIRHQRIVFEGAIAEVCK